MKAIEENTIMPKRGHLVKFHTPYHDENPKQLYLLLEVFESNDIYKARADILALGTGFSFPPISKVNLEDLEVVEWNSSELIGHLATAHTKTGSNVSGKIVHILEEENNMDPLPTLKIHVILEDERGEMTAGQLLLDSFKHPIRKASIW